MGWLLERVLNLLALTPFLAVLFYYTYNIFSIPPLPKLEDTWWGAGQPKQDDQKIYPFKIQISEEAIKVFKFRLNVSKPLLPPLENTQHQYGINSKLLSEIINFWKTEYNWTESEAKLNKLPQFTTQVQGLKIHYLHIKPTDTEGKQVLPLLMLNGWRSSFIEFYEIVPLLTQKRENYDFVFEVIIPSLPGYAFSEAPVRPGFGAAQAAHFFKNFMKRLGFDRFYLQGGDMGGFVAQHLAAMYPDVVLGVHINQCFLLTPWSIIKTILYGIKPSFFISNKDQITRMYPVMDLLMNFTYESGYMHIQSTKPDTIGVALGDSPTGLAAYILEKYIYDTNLNFVYREDGGLLEKYTYTYLLDNVMIYWWTNTIQKTFRFHADTFNKKHMGLQVFRQPVTPPSACTRMKWDFWALTEVLSDIYVNILHTPYIEGGHFSLIEMPEVMAEDIFIAVDKFRNFNKQNAR